MCHFLSDVNITIEQSDLPGTQPGAPRRRRLAVARELTRWLHVGTKMEIEILSRPTGSTADEILSIVGDLTGEWFTPDVAPATRHDLLFQDVVYGKQNGRIRAFIMFTSHDGAILITLMGTHPDWRGRGFGTSLMDRLVTHAKALGFCEIVTFTVPPASKLAYRATVNFYEKRGFAVAKKYSELWQSGAWELRKSLTDTSQQSAAADVAGSAAE